MIDKLTGTESLGIEFGSTRIKSVLIDKNATVLAQGDHCWNDTLADGFWSYSFDDIILGLQKSFAALNESCLKKFGKKIEKLGAIGISGMMHGYIALDENDKFLVPFRTWKNTTTSQASSKLSQLFSFNIPQRWSISHLYQAMLNDEEHVKNICHITTLAGFVSFLLCGSRTLGSDEASGMFPLGENGSYDKTMLEKFGKLSVNYSWKIEDILPPVAPCGQIIGNLSKEGAALLDPLGILQPGAAFCPPEGDAGTGMVATNSISSGIGNVSAGTSVFSMIVLEEMPKQQHEEIDIVSTPDGKPVAMVHCNNCCSEIDAWVKFVQNCFSTFGIEMDMNQCYDVFYRCALQGEAAGGGLSLINCLAAEPVAHVEQSLLALLRSEDANFNLPNLARSLIYSSVCTLKIGHEILEKMNVKIKCLNAHGGLFKTSNSGQQIMADALKADVCVSKNAAEGGAWGMALLAEYARRDENGSLEEFLSDIFANFESKKISPNQSGIEGFEKYFAKFKNNLVRLS